MWNVLFTSRVYFYSLCCVNILFLIPKECDIKSLKTSKTVLLDWLYFYALYKLFLKQINMKIAKFLDLRCNIISNALIQFLAYIFRSGTIFFKLTWIFIFIFLTIITWAINLINYIMLHHYLLKFCALQYLRLTFQNYVWVTTCLKIWQ